MHIKQPDENFRKNRGKKTITEQIYNLLPETKFKGNLLGDTALGCLLLTSS